MLNRSSALSAGSAVVAGSAGDAVTVPGELDPGVPTWVTGGSGADAEQPATSTTASQIQRLTLSMLSGLWAKEQGYLVEFV